MSNVYDKDLQDIIRQTSKELEIPIKEGVYIQYTGLTLKLLKKLRWQEY